MKIPSDHMRTLKRRVDFLKSRDHKNSFDLAELGALEWAIVNLQPAPVQEPVAWRYDLKQTGSFAGVSREYSPIKLSIGENWTPLYTTPPAAKRLWVGLTDDEIYDSYNEPRSDSEMVAFARKVEAKLKEKNI
jgi:hypothetical protein